METASTCPRGIGTRRSERRLYKPPSPTQGVFSCPSKNTVLHSSTSTVFFFPFHFLNTYFRPAGHPLIQQVESFSQITSFNMYFSAVLLSAALLASSALAGPITARDDSYDNGYGNGYDNGYDNGDGNNNGYNNGGETQTRI